MGLLKLLRSLKKNDKEARILVLGLDNAGKTTILKALSEEDISTIMPTQGFNIKALVNIIFEMGGWVVSAVYVLRLCFPWWFQILTAFLDSGRFQAQRLGYRRIKSHQTLLEELL